MQGMGKRLVITVDGPAGSGKSTVSRILADRISYMYLDTGLLYRVVAYAAMQSAIALDDSTALEALCSRITILPRTADGNMNVLIDGEDVSGNVRTEEISMRASTISAVSAVRQALLLPQRNAGRDGGIVAEGRDMGTIVFPGADIKFFLDADVDERAKRRYLQLMESGSNVDLDEIKRGLEARDSQDTQRKIAPLKPAGDSVIIDTTGIDVDGVVEKMITIVEKHTGQTRR